MRGFGWFRSRTMANHFRKSPCESKWLIMNFHTFPARHLSMWIIRTKILNARLIPYQICMNRFNKLWEADDKKNEIISFLYFFDSIRKVWDRKNKIMKPKIYSMLINWSKSCWYAQKNVYFKNVRPHRTLIPKKHKSDWLKKNPSNL